MVDLVKGVVVKNLIKVSLACLSFGFCYLGATSEGPVVSATGSESSLSREDFSRIAFCLEKINDGKIQYNKAWRYYIDNKVLNKIIAFAGRMESGGDAHIESVVKYVNEVGLEPLHEAVKFGDVGSVKSFLENGVNVNGLDIDGNTPLHLALSVRGYDTYKQGDRFGKFVTINDKDSLMIVAHILSYKPDISIVNGCGKTVLHSLAEGYCYQWKAELLACHIAKNRIDISTLKEDKKYCGKSPYDYARENGYCVDALYIHFNVELSDILKIRCKDTIAKWNEKREKWSPETALTGCDCRDEILGILNPPHLTTSSV